MRHINRKITYEGNLWRFYVINFIVGFRFIAAINLLYYQAFKITYTQIGLIELWAAVTIIVLEVPSGIFADLFGRKRSMLVGYVLSVTAFLIMGMGGSLVAFIIGWSFSGAADAFESGANDALLYDTLKEINRTEDYIKIKSRFILIYAFTVIVGSISGAYFYTINIRLPWLLFAGCIAICGIIYCFMKEPPMAREENRDGSIKNFAKSLKLSISNKTVLWLITFSILIGIPMYAFAVMMSQPYLVSRGFNIATIGVIFAVIRGMSGFLGSLSHRVEAKLGEKNSFFAIVILFVVLLVSAGLLKAKWVFIIIIALYTLEKYKSVVIDNYMNKHIDSASRATMLSIQSFLNNIVVTAIIVFIGHMIDLYSIDVVLIALGVMVGLLSIPFLFLRFIRVPDDKVVERI